MRDATLRRVLKRALVAFVSFTAAGTIYGADKEIVIGSDPWCPYQCFDQGKPRGITLDIVRHVFEPKGYRVSMLSLPWTRAIQMLREGKITTFGSAAKADAPEMVFATEPTTVMRNTIFKRADDTWRYKGIDSLHEGTLGFVQSYTYGTAIDAHIRQNPKKTEKSSGENALRSMILMVDSKRIRFFVEDRVIGLYGIAKNGLATKVVPAASITSVPLYFGFSPKTPDAPKLAKVLSEELVKMRKDGTLKEIYARYGVEMPELTDSSSTEGN